MAEPIEWRTPTHTLTITVPLNLEANLAAEGHGIQGALAHAMNAILPMTELGTLGLLCDQIVVTLEEVTDE